MQLEGLQIGSYRLLRLIGGGGMGDVYLAEDLRVNRQVAIKVIQTRATPYLDNGTTQDTMRLFQREVKAVAKLDHPHILPFFDCGGGNINGMNITYMVMPFRREGSLLAWLREHSPYKALPPHHVAHFLHQAADALQYAHDQQIIHRDVKPSNFLIRSNKENPDSPDLLLADFGLAKFSNMTSAVSQGNYGTPIYMAPEHWDGHPVPATDQYALAVMAYELLTGRPPFLGNHQQVMYQHLEVQPQLPSKFNSLIHADIDAVILRALAKRPEDRFPSISAFAHAFEQALPGVERFDRGQGLQHQLPDIEHSARVQVLQKPLQGIDGRRQAHVPTRGGETSPIGIPTSISTTGGGKLPGRRQAPPPFPTSTPLPPLRSVPIPTNGKVPITRGRDRSTSKEIVFIGLVLLFVTVSAAVFTYMSIPQKTKVEGTTPTINWGATAEATVHPTFPVGRRQAPPPHSLPLPPQHSPYSPYKGVLAFYDPLQDNSKGNNWDEVTDSRGSCVFTQRSYQVTASARASLYFCTEEAAFSNFAYQVQMTIVAGDYGGIVFRTDSTHTKFYYFRIGKDGSYEVVTWGSKTGKKDQVLKSGTSLAIKTGLDQSNIVAVVASGSDLDLYVNQQHIAYVSDSTFSQGQLGVCAANASKLTEVMYSDALVWKL
jgi:serine/threonine protein kinase